MKVWRKFFVSLDQSEGAQWERGACGLTARLGTWLFAVGHLAYRDRARERSWPKWATFGVSIGGPVATSMSWRRTNYLYLCGRRVFDTTYWSDCRVPASPRRANRV